eukprot:GEMP01056618.1.p1 GENE.GEMP01056618.1~~GEMP01056618.1.p1  ORF type:complete len:125 (+),score=17.26 GEMP01056618.1:156-530(+)
MKMNMWRMGQAHKKTLKWCLKEPRKEPRKELCKELCRGSKILTRDRHLKRTSCSSAFLICTGRKAFATTDQFSRSSAKFEVTGRRKGGQVFLGLSRQMPLEPFDKNIFFFCGKMCQLNRQKPQK